MAMLQLVLLLSQVPSILAICSFPDFLTSVPYWEGHIQNEHYRPDQLLTFRGDTMRMNIYWPNYKVRFLKCHSVHKDNRFIVVDTSEGQPTFKCIQFLKRSAYVMQTAESRISKVDDPAICRTDALQLSAWPFLYPVLRDVYVDCPRIGGYDMYMYTYENNELVTKCDPFIPARLESECMPGEGMLFNFQHHDCVDGWSMSINQEALCLGSWTDDNFTFVILHDKADYFAKIWMLRLPSTPSEYFRAYLIKDIVADTNTTIAQEKQKKYIAINMQRRIMKSLCEDESPKCNNSCTSDSMKNYCFKSCKVCEDTKLPNCTLRPDSLGQWHDSSIGGSKYINITNDTMHIDKMPPLKCVDLSHGTKTRNSGYRSLVSIFENGCRPRFSCGSFERLSNSIQHFRLSQPVTPTATSIILTGDVCFPLNFRPDTTPLKNFYRSTNKKNLLRVPPPPKTRPLVSCGLKGPLEVNVTYDSGVNCTAKILNCNLTKSIVWQTDNGCAEPGPTRIVYNCLASYSILTKAFIITERQDDHTDVHCWVYNDDVYRHIPNRLYIMRPADCNLQSMNDIQYSGLEIFVSNVSFQMAQFSSRKECAGVVPSTQEASTTAEMTQITTVVAHESDDDITSYTTGVSSPVSVKDLVTKATITKAPYDSTTDTVAPEMPLGTETTSDVTMSHTKETEEQTTEQKHWLQASSTYDSATTALVEEVTMTSDSPPNGSPMVGVTVMDDILSTSGMIGTTASINANTDDTALYEQTTDIQIMREAAEAVFRPGVLRHRDTAVDDQTMAVTLMVNTDPTTETGDHLEKTTVEQQEAVTEEINELSIDAAEDREFVTSAASISPNAIPNLSLPADQETTASLEDKSVNAKTTSDNLQIKETVTEKTDDNDYSTEAFLSSIDVTSEKPLAKAPEKRTGNSSAPSDSAQLSEVISLTSDLQVLNTTVINVTSDKISAGTQPTKFRAAKGDHLARPGNSIQMGAVKSASHQHSCSVLFIFVTLLSCILQSCINACVHS